MKPIFAIAALGATLTACAVGPTPEPSGSYFKAIELVEDAPLPVEIVETTAILPLPGQLKPVPEKGQDDATTPHLSPEEAMRKGVEDARMEPSEDGFINAIQVYPYTQGALYRLYASPYQVTDIALQPGEELISVSAGDTMRWVVGDTTSGGPEGRRAHVLVKPISEGLSTNLMIATDRRVYHLDLESTDSSYMAALSWRYPQDELTRLKARNEQAVRRERQTVERGLTIDDLNFKYRLDGDAPDWKPLRVFDDGAKVFIQMPESLQETDAPPLFILGRDGKTQLVNYRINGNYYVVDRLFERAELRLGEKDQTIVRITRAEGGGRRASFWNRGRS